MSDVEKKEVDLNVYRDDAAPHEYLTELNRMDAEDAQQFLNVGVESLRPGNSMNG